MTEKDSMDLKIDKQNLSNLNNTKKKCLFFNEQNIKDLWTNIKRFNIYVIRILE